MNQQNKKKILVKQLAENQINSDKDFYKLKQKICRELKMPMLSDIKIRQIYQDLRRQKQIPANPYLKRQLKTRPVRSLSGVAVIAVLTKPWPCPGQCLYCPTEEGIPKSYLSGEPAVERAKALDYDPYQQVQRRIASLDKSGHPTDKIELIVIGGTWSYLPPAYQEQFIKRCFQGANDCPAERSEGELEQESLESVQKKNETASHRIIGLTLETRPDYITPEEIVRMRQLGCTRVELGVQILNDRVLRKNKRGHGIKEIITATRLLKEAGFKICYHVMPGLLGSNIRRDLVSFKKMFSSPRFQPDMLKLYPCVVTEGSELYQLWQQGKYKPYSNQQLVNLLVKMKQLVPPYVRINRVIRDIPAWQIKGGSKISNLREIVQRKMAEQGQFCRCIRCREIKGTDFKIKKLELIQRNYQASDGEEIFLSYEAPEQNKLAAFLRLRLSPAGQRTLLDDQPLVLIREIHTYGQLISIGEAGEEQAAQHLGLGKKLVARAEKIARERGYKKIAVISGVGAREYWRKFGYRLENTYMVKELST